MGSNRLKIEPVSADLDNIDYIAMIYSKHLPYEKNFLFQFFYLYQVIELLMEIIFRQEQSELVREIVNAREDVNLMKDILDRVRNISSEKYRIKLITHQYSCKESNLNELKDACNNLLRTLGKGDGDNIANYLYPVRNFLFHQFRNFPPAADTALQDLVRALLRCLPQLMAKFKIV